MADSSWRDRVQEALPDDEYGITEVHSERRWSTSTSASRRHSYYDAQRGGETQSSEKRSSQRRSRPVSTSSQATTKSKGKRASYQSYQQPAAHSHVDGYAVPLPVTQLETHVPVTNFSRPVGDGVRRRAPSGASHNQNKSVDTTMSALPPMPKAERFSQQTTAQNTQHQGYDGTEPHQASRTSTNEPPPFSRRDRVDEDNDATKPSPRWLTELYTVSYLVLFSLLGTLARLGVQWITFYPGAPITTPVIWANMGGSFILGFLAEDQGLFRDHVQDLATAEKQDTDLAIDKALFTKHKKTIPLYVGLGVGFCGSFTSFSSFARDVFLALSNNLPAPVNHPDALVTGTLSPSSIIGRNGGYSFEALLAVILYTFALSLGGLIVGAHTALALYEVTPTLPARFVRKAVDPSMVVFAFGCWLGAVFLAIWPPDRPSGPSSRGSWTNETWRGEVLFALVFAPLGCLLRFYTSVKLNGLVAAFPLGTFAVNMFGTAIEGMCYDMQHVGVGIMGQVGGGRVGCQVLQGVQDGFCGCLTTISTWVAEINGLKRKHGYLYALASIVGGLCLMVIIMGSVRWTVGFREPVCSTGYPSKVLG
ncbi:uncharacterized protein MYCFIDRAFT_150933 [Pseudocercospora fijiensis CIRAD86]|uniref:Chromosome condensation protein n=1 Tax=Pseudocercospora fijiensis (strain CIRAD86) TaxID=383855 RepID=M3A446_PSEFD|nr:uncharacterized protein MYCFIDRAFT_150933 [Pseudocercospora fijiensis CIRAD86]EME85889.1 hypothetical protein MYCFIDRAFT_150933 [Pseudocercospora fijiensis CIRAD86]